ncbi:MAG: hypothetical protein IAF58_15085 [Leptolyngbya sp.]|nr:hypothetical protein [Candidatus Melainabacteria bacterium]
MVAAFIYCWSFNPAFGTPLFFEYTRGLKLSQNLIGQANASYSFGMLVGAFVYPIIWKYTPKHQIKIAIALSVTSTLSFLLLDSSNFFMLEFLRGVSGMLGILCINWLAAGVSPKGLETFATATLIGVYNIGTQTSGIIGAHLYSNVFHNSINPLLLIASSVTATCFLIQILFSRHTFKYDQDSESK